MRVVSVKFRGTPKSYFFKTNLSLIPGGEYKIVADGERTYDNPVTVEGYLISGHDEGLREITTADCIKAPQLRDDGIEQVWFNEKKGVTAVKWKDGVVTKVTCAPEDVFDKEKGLALCYMKRFFRNRGGFNDVVRKWCK